MAMRNGVWACVLAITAVSVQGQAAQEKVEFDVASVRTSAPLDLTKLAAQLQAGAAPRFGVHVEGTRAEYIYRSLKELIANAYGVKPYQVTGPAWMGSARFDVVAKMPEGAKKEEAPAMLQALLKERFGLTAHMETQEHPVLALVVGKDGPKLKDAGAPPEPVPDDAPLKPGEFKINGSDGLIRVTRNADGTTVLNMGARGTFTQKTDAQSQTIRMESNTVTMSGFADMLTNLMQMGGTSGQQIVDMTGLKGNYQVALDFSMADLIALVSDRMREMGIDMPGRSAGGGSADNQPASGVSDPAGRSSVYASVEKLGLKLETRKAVVEQVVVDKVEKTPTEN